MTAFVNRSDKVKNKQDGNDVDHDNGWAARNWDGELELFADCLGDNFSY